MVKRRNQYKAEGSSAARPPAEAPTDESSVYARGQTVIPKMIREAAAIDYGTRLHWEVHEGVIHVMPMPSQPVQALRGILKGTGFTFAQFMKERAQERQRERELEARQIEQLKVR